jgi:hypothetical protein
MVNTKKCKVQCFLWVFFPYSEDTLPNLALHSKAGIEMLVNNRIPLIKAINLIKKWHIVAARGGSNNAESWKQTESKCISVLV